MNAAERARLADELAPPAGRRASRRAALRAGPSARHAQHHRARARRWRSAHAAMPSITIGIVGDDLVVGDIPVPRAAETMGELMRRLQQAGIERIVIDRGVQSDEI